MNFELLDKNFLLINKPKGWTSFDVVAYVRKQTLAQLRHSEEERGDDVGIPMLKDPLSQGIATLPLGKLGVARNDATKKLRVGHAGTLDPFATGLLIVGVGREATKRLDEFKKLPKTYVATLHFGATSDTYDGTGTIHTIHDTDKLYRDPCIVHRDEISPKQQIIEALQTFIGKQLQTPPMFSAKKINGQRLYKLARQGKVIERQPNEIEIFDIKILDYSYPLLKIEVDCSTGTYIRSLAHDIGQKLTVGAYCEELIRTRIGDFKIEDAIEVSRLDGLKMN